MAGFLTLILILAPMFLAFCLPKNQKLAHLFEKLLNYVVFLLLIIIGTELALVADLYQKLMQIMRYLSVLLVLTIGSGLIALYVFDKLSPYLVVQSGQVVSKVSWSSLGGSFVQICCIALGFVLGRLLPESLLPPHWSTTVLLMCLLWMVGVLLKNSEISLRQALLNWRGLQISLIYMTAVLSSGLVYAMIFQEVSWSKALALASGFGWYSLSGSLMTDAYGIVWGSVALLNDLTREILAMIFIPYVMKKSSSAAIGLAGVTALDFTLPVLQRAGGRQIMPIAISFGFITNVMSPILMVFFSTLSKG